MPTDDERRRIAAKLRANAGTGYIEVEPLCEAIGCDARRGSGEGTVWNRLADLIEPGEPEVRCVAEVKIDGERLEQLVHDAVAEVTGIDRDALLALADEFDDRAETIARHIESSDGDFDRHAIDAMEEQYGYANRIREILGVTE